MTVLALQTAEAVSLSWPSAVVIIVFVLALCFVTWVIFKD
jgi:ABC-type phosphate transport system permease subunit